MRKLVFHIANMVWLSITLLLRQKRPQTYNVLMAFAMVSVLTMLKTWMKSMLTLVAKALVMRLNVVSCLGPLVCHQVIMTLISKRPVKCVP
ncbi:Uncharacterised protein [Chlamydia trachomatis]|nr:Uncharacterised protein [Chlamydia trachomatis]